jgi:hypothetical protein
MTIRVPTQALAAVMCATALGVAGCRGLPAGPSLSDVTLSNIALQSTTGNPALCCCRIVGAARNDNGVSVHVTLKFSAFDGVIADPITKILFYIGDIEPGGSRQIDAPGFVYPCQVIKRLTTEVDMKGIAFPPQ